jgi:hypothetical protein
MAHAASHSVRFVKRHLALLLVFLFLILIGGAYIFGFRPGPGLTFVRVGTLVVEGIPDGTGVYVDQSSRGTSRGGSLSAALVPGAHTVIVDPPGDEPWQKTVSIVSNEETSVSPILVAKTPHAVPLSGSEAAAALALKNGTFVPTIDAPLLMGCERVYVSNNRVIADVAATNPCTPPEYLCSLGACEPTVVYSPANPIRAVVPLPGRTDAIIVSVGEWAYVLGLDPRTPQYFAPLAHGVAPVAVPAATSSVYLIDEGKSYRISL